MRYGELLRQRRQRAGQTLADVAAVAGFTMAYISDIERGNRGPLEDDVTIRIAEALSADALELLAAAGQERGHYRISAGSESARNDVAVLLARKWATLTPEQVERVRRAVK